MESSANQARKSPTLRGARIQVTGLSHRYRHTDVNALEDVSFTIEPGECVALIGRSGCGKSTLLHIIAGLTRPSTGEIRIDGDLVSGPSPRWVMMFQQPSLFPWLNVAANVSLGFRFSGKSRAAPARVAELLRLLELSDFANLGGKRLAVPFWYSMHNIVLQIALRAAQLTPVIKGENEPVAPKRSQSSDFTAA